MVYAERTLIKICQNRSGNRYILGADFAFRHLRPKPNALGGFAFSYFERLFHCLANNLMQASQAGKWLFRQPQAALLC
jgi:hypothetical protein